MSDPWSRSTFPKARRRKAVRRLTEALSNEDTRELLPLGEVTRRLGVFRQHHVGIRPIPMARIVGTVDRTGDYDREFLPRRRDVGERWRSLERSVPPESFPPIRVYEVDGRYFVEDGHNRVAIARQLGMESIDAEVTALRTRTPLPDDADVPRLILREQEQLFLDRSGLSLSRPQARIELSRPAGYRELLEQVEVHGYHLIRERRHILDLGEVAADWFDGVYHPTVDAIRNEGLADLFPRATPADLFLWVQHHRLDLFAEHGERSLQDDIRTLRDGEMSSRRRRARIRGQPRART